MLLEMLFKLKKQKNNYMVKNLSVKIYILKSTFG